MSVAFDGNGSRSKSRLYYYDYTYFDDDEDDDADDGRSELFAFKQRAPREDESLARTAQLVHQHYYCDPLTNYTSHGIVRQSIKPGDDYDDDDGDYAVGKHTSIDGDRIKQAHTDRHSLCAQLFCSR